MPSIFRTRDRLVFAHRGGAKLAPENTMAAFERGLALGSDGLELDVHLARDGVPVVIHDKTLDRTTDRRGPVADYTSAELAGVDAGYHFTTAETTPAAPCTWPFRGQGHGVPTLEAVLRRFPAHPVIVEMKDGDGTLARAVIDVLRRTEALDRVCVASFDQRGLQVIRREAPELCTSASINETRWTLYRSWVRWPLRSSHPYVAFQVPEYAKALKVVSPAFVRRAHRDGARVDVWVVDRAEDITRLFDWGVNGVITDRPDVAVPTRNAWVQR